MLRTPLSAEPTLDCVRLRVVPQCSGVRIVDACRKPFRKQAVVPLEDHPQFSMWAVFKNLLRRNRLSMNSRYRATSLRCQRDSTPVEFCRDVFAHFSECRHLLRPSVQRLVPRYELGTVSSQPSDRHRRLNAISDDGCPQRTVRHTELSRSVRHGHAFTADRDQTVRRRVVGLLSVGRPSAVVRSVIAIVVDAFNRMIVGRPLAHIREKLCEVSAPSFAYANTSCAVGVKACVASVVTTLLHVEPHTIFRRACSAVRSSHSNRSFRSIASAASRIPCQQIATYHNDRTTAVAFAFNTTRLSDHFGFALGNQSPETATNNV